MNHALARLAAGLILGALLLLATLCHGQYTIHPLVVQWPTETKTDANLSTAIMLDTATGRTWILSPRNDDAIPPVAWVQIPIFVPHNVSKGTNDAAADALTNATPRAVAPSLPAK